LAILGASGSGKTTLLNALNLRNRGSLKFEGDVKVNGERVNSVEEISSMSGYVQQNDLFIGTLKVKEHLIFQVSFMSHSSPFLYALVNFSSSSILSLYICNEFMRCKELEFLEELL
jgi:ABC-type multidrug transport system ATPase subunit